MAHFCSNYKLLGRGWGDPKFFLDIFFWGGDPRKNGNFQIFTHPPPPLINNERSLIDR